MTPAATFRTLNDPPLDGAANMARDEALLASVGGGESPPTLRLYQWSEPTISLGYFQKYADYTSLPPPAGKLAVVRRPTGGGAILHDLELTYSITLPAGHPLVARGPNTLYELAHDAVMSALRGLDLSPARCGVCDDSGAARGPFFCFARRHCYDVLVGPDKIAGSAQRRTRRAVLQHGSIVLANRFAQHPTAVAARPFGAAVLHLRTSFPQVLEAMSGIAGQRDDWSSFELDLARELTAKHVSLEWIRRT